MSWIDGALTRARLWFGRGANDTRFDREFAFHVDMEAERLVREEQLAPAEARRRALVSFGPVQSHRESFRDGRGMNWLNGLSLDLRLGLRVLRKYPGLTAVGVIGMGMAVALATFFFTMVELSLHPVLPLPNGERIVGIRTWDLKANQSVSGRLYDYNVFRESLKSVDAMGAFQMSERNLILADRSGAEITTADMTASAFRAVGVSPILGRSFTERDEDPGSPPVVIVSHDLWQQRFSGDPAILDKVIRLGPTSYTVVGVMPRGFAFPVGQDAWLPLRINPAVAAPGAGPPVFIFARLAAGMTSKAAQVELTNVGRRLAAEQPEVRRDREVRFVNFPTLVGMTLVNESDGAIGWIPVLISLVLIVVSVNVATLVYARTAARQREIAVRASLGASRGRIIGQLFAEAFVLSAAASVIGLVVSRVAFGMILGRLAQSGSQVPFWLQPRITPGLMMYVVALTLLAAFIVGVLPARSASLHGVRAALSTLGSGDTVRLGRAWSALIIMQVGVAVAILPAIVMLSGTYGYYSLRPLGFPADQYLTSVVEFDRTTETESLSHADRLARLERSLEAEHGVAAVTFATSLIGQEQFTRIEFDTAGTDSTTRVQQEIRLSAVMQDFMTQFDIVLRQGRAFSASDFESGSNAIIVNEEFVREALHGRSAIGHRIRRVSSGGNQSVANARASTRGDESQWMEIVGVVSVFPPRRTNPEASEARMYEPLRRNARLPLAWMTARTTVPPASLSVRVQQIALSVDPGLRMGRIVPLDAVYRAGERGLSRLISLMMGLITICILVLSGAGMSSLMAFTVTRRRREIGIRSALGADRGQLLRSVFARVARQLGAGCATGLFLGWALDRWSGGELMGEYSPVTISLVIILVMITGLLAALGPARRGLRVPPADALRSD